jgi:hypothetical protein
MKDFVLGVIFTVAVFIVGALAYLLLGFAEVRGDVPGTQLESRLMTATVHASVRKHAPELANPFPPSDETLVAGGEIFLNVRAAMALQGRPPTIQTNCIHQRPTIAESGHPI